MEKSVKRFYWTALFFLLILSAYPILMGVRIVVLQFQGGSIHPDHYAQYVIPYAAVCSSILITILLYPLLKNLKRFSVPAASTLGLALFTGLEWYMEGITINSAIAQSTLQWQLASCISSTEGMQAFQKLFDNTLKIHYHMISFLLILLIIGSVYSYANVLSSKDRTRKNILQLQILFTVLLIVFCITANIAAFFRDAVDYLIPLSSILTGSFFVLIGVTFGVYLASFLTGKSRLVSGALPAVGAFLITSAMYYGEYKMLDGVLYRFGYTKFFQPLPYTAVTLVDVLIILSSGILTAIFVGTIRRFSKKQRKQYQESV